MVGRLTGWMGGWMVASAAQIVGAILGAALARGCSPAGFSGVQGAANRLTTITWGGAFLAEILGNDHA